MFVLVYTHSSEIKQLDHNHNTHAMGDIEIERTLTIRMGDSGMVPNFESLRNNHKTVYFNY